MAAQNNLRGVYLDSWAEPKFLLQEYWVIYQLIDELSRIQVTLSQLLGTEIDVRPEWDASRSIELYRCAVRQLSVTG